VRNNKKDGHSRRDAKEPTIKETPRNPRSWVRAFSFSFLFFLSFSQVFLRLGVEPSYEYGEEEQSSAAEYRQDDTKQSALSRQKFGH
jgi:hypothetical protein